MTDQYGIDFETRSQVDLLTAGAYNYSSDPSTEIICMYYAKNDEEPKQWLPSMPFPKALARHIKKGLRLNAFNATFERLIWAFILTPDFNAPEPKLEQWHCTAFASRCNNMPAALGNAARCLGVDQQKSGRGKALIKLLCVPMADGTFYKDPELLEEFYEYCAQDVRTERAVKNQIREPSASEWRDYFVNERINDRGVRIDRPLALAAQEYASEEKADLEQTIQDITSGEVAKARGEKLKAWVVERLTEEQTKLLVKYRNGEKKLSLDKYNRSRLLSLDDLDPDVYEVVEASDFAQRSSVGKFKSMCDVADPEDDRVRGVFMCNGAAASGRYSSRKLQAHNFPRSVMKDPEEVRLDLIENIMPEDIVDYYELNIMTLLAKMLRSALIPRKGYKFVGADWAAIEGRVAPWLADSADGRKKLQLYLDDIDTYIVAARDIYNCTAEEIDDARRQVGKVAELSLQFGGGAKAFAGMARGYGVIVTNSEAETVKEAWRMANPWAVDMWAQCQRAAFSAVRYPTERFTAGRVSYLAVEDILAGGLTLFCELPCGRLLTYPDVRISMEVAPWGEDVPKLSCLRAAWTPKATEKEWPRSGLYGGLLFENIVQGTAASILRGALAEADARGLPVVLDVHDEIIAEVRAKDVKKASKMLSEIMLTPPSWAVALPLKAEIQVTDRFGK